MLKITFVQTVPLAELVSEGPSEAQIKLIKLSSQIMRIMEASVKYE